MSIKQKWNDRYRSASSEPVQAARVLRENLYLLPDSGEALDLACGRGGNAYELARQDLQVQAWDISDVVIAELKKNANEQGIPIEALVRDVEIHPPAKNSFDIIVVSYYLERKIIPDLVAALKPGGLIFYQTFSQEKVSDRGPQRKEFRLARQELLHLFSDLELIFYREDGLFGDTNAGVRDETMFVGARTK